MKSRWTDKGAREAVDRWGNRYGEAFALRVYTARLIGADTALVLHGGGNVSLKATHRTRSGDDIDAVYVKGSGRDLADLEPEELVGLDLTYLRRLRSLELLDDEAMVDEFRMHLLGASAPTPSIETLLHAFLPHRYIDHSHADAVLTITNQPDGVGHVRQVLGERVAVVEYVRPGLELAKAVVDCHESNPKVEGMVLLNHGLVTFGDDARTSYERHIALVDACERYVEKKCRGRSLTPCFEVAERPADLAARVAPVLRGLIAEPTDDEDQPHERSILEWRAGDNVLAFVNSAEAKTLAGSGPLTGDHVIHTKLKPLFIENPDWGNDTALLAQLKEAVEAYRRDYIQYITAHSGQAEKLATSPRVVLLPGAGMFCWCRGKREARITADIAEHTMIAQTRAHFIGAYKALPSNHVYDMECRSAQRRKLGSRARRPLESQVVVISGGAGAIGAAVAEVCAEAGAHVAVADIDVDRIAPVVRRVEARSGPGTACGIVMDVTDEQSVSAGYADVVRIYGGVDVVVPNAGIAHVASIEDMRVDDFRRVMDINAVGYLLFMREGIRILKRQALGGNVVVMASKNVFGPGKDFGAYSASKAAGHQLGKVAAMELAPAGIRVNMINADAIFGDEETPSGLWSTVGPGRAKSRNLDLEQLPEYYRQRNLLKAMVRGRHVGNAVVFFASNATPTTGATLPVDGGVVEAFPR